MTGVKRPSDKSPETKMVVSSTVKKLTTMYQKAYRARGASGHFTIAISFNIQEDPTLPQRRQLWAITPQWNENVGMVLGKAIKEFDFA